ncbi:uracil-DNA glycosylase [Chondromyces apiculatus]|uniref:Type-4 uracil-DNA glycosylase n=1 Tax=Chondromyces apiculatus DSM 436 TaxID=1192034 RepID=A0A017SYZ2_9BACT|nr:uracil-DNA glycosylase [Chondromyces apiculatus]EYF02204.1 Uracil-DNA glycosylase, family 4 [Chondromyces apiculatus DSM 436]
MEADALRQELADLTAAVRAFLDWHVMTGTTGLPPGEAPSSAAPAHLPHLPASLEPERPPRSPAATYEEPKPARPLSAAPAAAPVAAYEAPRPAGSVTAAPMHAAQATEPVRQDRPSPRPVEAPRAVAAPVAAAPAPTAGPTTDTLDERRARLTVLASEVAGCQRCDLHAGRTHTVVQRGNPNSELVFIGEGPGMEEDRSGEPFVGPAGQLLDKMIAAMGYHRDDVYICNIVKCRPPNNRKPEAAEMAACSPYLATQLGIVNPRVIVALGATAVQGLIGTTEGITRLRGTWKLYKGAIPLMPTFHPAYLLRQPSAKREVWSDLKMVMTFLGRSVPERH